ncbi:MAG: glycosyltransferase family 39 protein, partial [Planctomycetia bacterium]|nr:glycosyltransferase family 39 protein [Planctomycetia bacterium]
MTTSQDHSSPTCPGTNAKNASPQRDSLINERLFWPIVLLLGLCLTLIPYLVQPSFRVDIVHQFGLSREYVPGTYMFPAFASWLLRGVCLLTGEALFSPYLCAAIITVLTLYGLWRLGREYLSKELAFWGAVSMCTYWYFNTGCMLYNNNGPMIMFMVYAFLFFHFALKTNLPIFWIATGAALGFNLICKYTGIIPIATIVLYMFYSRHARRYWFGIGPYLSIVTAAIIFIPNALFILDHRDAIRAYIDSKKSVGTLPGFTKDFVIGWLEQLVIALPVLLTLTPLFGKWFVLRQTESTSTSDATGTTDTVTVERSFLPFMFFVPFFVQAILQCISGVAFHQTSY